jgi:DNA-binding CsgD family transcriptional regulator
MISLIDGEMTIGLIFILLSIGVAVRHGFFRKYPVIKLVIYTGIVIACVCIHSYFFPKTFIRNLLEVVLYTVFVIVIYFMFRKDLENYFKRKSRKSLRKDYNLTEREVDYVLSLLKGNTMKEIAFENNVEEATVRTSFHRIYKKIGVKDGKQLGLMTGAIEFIP